MSAPGRSTPEWLLGAIVAAAASVAVLYAGEASLLVLRSDPGFAAIRAAAARGEPYDERTRQEVVRDLRAEGVDAVARTVPAALLVEQADGSVRSRLERGGEELLPLGGISGKTVVLCNETGDYAVYRSDEAGFRNPPGLWDRVPADVVLIGDSFTAGECVGEGRDLGSLIRARHPATLNLGVGGHGPLLELAALREYGPALRPRRVVWFYFENDLWWFDLGKQRRAPLLLRYLEDPEFSQGLIRRQPEIDAALTELWAAVDVNPDPNPVEVMRERRGTLAYRVLGFVTLRSLRTAVRGLLQPPESPVGEEEPDFDTFRRVLAQARDETASWGGELVFVYLPGVWHYDRGLLSREPGEDPLRRRVLAIASELELPVVDMLPVLGRHPEPLSLYSYPGTSLIGPPHLNAAGYAEVAQEVLPQLEPGGSGGTAGDPVDGARHARSILDW